MNRISISASAVLLALVCLAPVATATTLTPGQSVCASGCTFSPIVDFGMLSLGTERATTGILPFSSTPSGAFTGLVDSYVYTDTGTGDLDFLYYLEDDSTSADTLGRLTASNFSGVTTDVGYSSFYGGAVAPTLITRGSGTGDTIGFNFTPGGLPQDDLSYLLVIKTNATNFTTGNVSIIDGGTANVSSYEPTPEPAFSSLLLGGLFRPRTSQIDV
jgi:hypothetical protein